MTFFDICIRYRLNTYVFQGMLSICKELFEQWWWWASFTCNSNSFTFKIQSRFVKTYYYYASYLHYSCWHIFAWWLLTDSCLFVSFLLLNSPSYLVVTWPDGVLICKLAAPNSWLPPKILAFPVGDLQDNVTFLIICID